MELETGKMTENSYALAEEAGDNNIDQVKLGSDIGNKEDLNRLAEATTVIVQEQGENYDLVEGMIGKTSRPEETDFMAGNLRNNTNTAAVIVGQNQKFTLRSRYLSASVGSCHDLCKSGHKHEEEKPTKKPVLRTIREVQPLMRTTSDDLAKSILKEETKKKALLRRLSLPGPIAEKGPPTCIEDMICSKRDLSWSKPKRRQSDINPCSVPGSGHSSNRSLTDVQSAKKTVFQSLNLLESSNKRVEKVERRKEAGGHKKGETVKAKEAKSNGLSPETHLKRSPSMKVRLYKNLKSFSLSFSKNKTNSEEAEANGSCDVPEKILYMVEPNSKKRPAKEASKTASRDKSTPSTPRGSCVSKAKGSKSNLKGNVSLPSVSSPPVSVSTALTAEDPSQPWGENKWDLDSIKTKQTGKITEEGGSQTNTSRAKSNVDPNMKAKMTGKDGSAWKVKFRRGAATALQVANSAPKKLRFKRGRTLGGDQDATIEIDGILKNIEAMSNEPHDTNRGPEKVLLRHQEAYGKKDSVDLNNVIEETASKLVKTRKSKVKALVGAFETVMSLHDRKHLVKTSAS